MHFASYHLHFANNSSKSEAKPSIFIFKLFARNNWGSIRITFEVTKVSPPLARRHVLEEVVELREVVLVAARVVAWGTITKCAVS